MNNVETKIFLQTKLRNLKRRYATIEALVSRSEELIQLKKEIEYIEQELTEY